MSTQQSAYTYLGPWINWSHGAVRGSTLTLDSRDGALLTAFLALFVAIAGGALWRILAFVFHQVRAGQEVHDGFHHQQQAILRNISSPGAALWQSVHLGYFWWHSARRPVWRSLQLSFLALLSLALLAAASIFSSQLTRATGHETLILSDNCGIWGTGNLSHIAELQVYNRKVLGDSISAAAYARNCYGNDSDTLQCNQYIQRQIHSMANRNATCPFTSGICMISDTAAYELDTGPIDSHVHLGINTPEKDRVTYRRRETCAPLNRDGYVTVLNATDTSAPDGGILGQPGDVFTFYNFGPTMTQNYTFAYNHHAAFDVLGYGLTSSFYQGGQAPDAWTPVAALRREDADVSIVFMTSNSLRYDDMVYDPFFATDEQEHSFMADDQNSTYYKSKYLVSIMACIDQHQFCNPNNDQCTNLTSSAAAVKLTKTIGMNLVQQRIIWRFKFHLLYSSLDSSLAGRGGAALRAQEFVHDFQSDHLPHDQWMIEVESLFNTGLAKLQRNMVEYAAGPQRVIDGGQMNTFGDPISISMCRKQMVHSTSNTTNFSVLGLALVLTIGSALVLTNLVLDRVVGYIQQRYQTGNHRRLQWIVDEKLQLQRLAFEEAGMGTWAGGAAAVPVTRLGERFGIPRNANPDHPRLREPVGMRATGGGEYESARLMHDKISSTETTVQVFDSI